jgi:proline dehydrogenase
VAILDRALVTLLPAVPKPVVRRLAGRYIAGDELEDAVDVVRTVNGEGKLATVDVLGEEITSLDDARAIAGAYHDVFETIDREGLDSNVSVKLTGLGLNLDFDVCRDNVDALVADAAARDNFVRIDMEDSSTTDDTLRLYRDLREAGHERLGVVLQATLKRTLADVDALADLRPNVRVCKGIYVEPPAIAFREFEAVRGNFVRVLEALLDAGCYVGIATHDDWLVDRARETIAERGLERDEYEFQMLLGVRPELGDSVVRDGHRLRIYVPFGTHWYRYSIRRLQENPKIAGYVAADTFGRLLHPLRGPGTQNGQ